MALDDRCSTFCTDGKRAKDAYCSKIAGTVECGFDEQIRIAGIQKCPYVDKRTMIWEEE